MSKQTVEQELMTEWGYTWDRACEMVNDHIDAVAAAKIGGWNNREIANKVVDLCAGRLQFANGTFHVPDPIQQLLRGPKVDQDGKIIGGIWHGMTPDEVIADRDAFRSNVGHGP